MPEDEKELLAEIAAELGIDPANPNVDQFGAAVSETLSRARKGVKQRLLPGDPKPVMYRLGNHDLIPPMISRWLGMYSDRLQYDGRLCRPEHVGQATPTTLFASTPNLRYCDPCADRRARELRSNAAKTGDPFQMDCDFCGVPADLLTLRNVFLPVVTILIRGLACKRCLTHSAVPA